MIGKTLAHYEIIAELGRGGMGEVYRAHDARLGRDVAIKVLPTNLTGNPEIRARFEREAKTISSLNHPNICTLYDVGSEGGIDYLVMEVVEGETLSERLTHGPLPLEEISRIGGQLADALDRAHREGVVHRDLKPGNIMLTRSGAKLMDFGLARVTGLAGPDSLSSLQHSPTIAQPLTSEGTLVGTFQYMSPEQLEGKEVDARADLWALGCVLYEMATGRRAFDAGSQASLIGAIMHAKPQPVSAVSDASPPELDRLIQACLEKDPLDRVQSAHDLKLQLGWITEGSPADSEAAARRSGSTPWLLIGTIAVAAAIVGALAMKLASGGEGANVGDTARRYALARLDLVVSSLPMLSTDGNSVVVAAESGGTQQLYRRDFASLQATPIPQTEGAYAPFFSPDGSWMGFLTRDGIKKIPTAGGMAQTIVSYTRAGSAAWGTDGYIYFTAADGGFEGDLALARVPDSGGTYEIVLRLDLEAGDSESWLPQMLPDGETILLSIIGGGESGWQLLAVRPDGSRQLVRDGAFLGRYVAPDMLVYRDADSESVFGIRFDPKTLGTSGSPLPLTEPIDLSFCYDVNARDLVYVPVPGSDQGSEIVWREPGGATTLLVETRAPWRQPRLSPDGTRLLLRKVSSRCETWLYDIPRATLSRLLHGNDNHDAIWSDDGNSIALEHGESNELVTFRVDGPRETKVLATGSEHGAPTSWSNGLLAYTRTGKGSRNDIWLYPLDESQPPFAYLESEADETQAAISPDARWIAYVSDETGSTEVYLRRYPDDGNFWQISVDGGNYPLWARDGSQIYYEHKNQLTSVSIRASEDPILGKPELVLGEELSTSSGRGFDVSEDGRFVAIRHVDDSGSNQQIRVLQDWQAEFRRLSGDTR